MCCCLLLNDLELKMDRLVLCAEINPSDTTYPASGLPLDAAVHLDGSLEC